MKVKVIARFKNDNFIQARLENGFLTQRSLAKTLNINHNMICVWENFRGYPRKKYSKLLIEKLEKTLKRPFDMLFPPEYIEAVNRKLGRPIEKTFDLLELPSYATGNLCLPSPEETYDLMELKEKIEEILGLLTHREATILKMRFGLGDGIEHDLIEVGKTFKITRERVRQIENHALRKLESKEAYYNHNKKLKPFLVKNET